MLLGIDQLCALNPKRPTSNREKLTHRDGKKGKLLPTQWSCKESLDGYRSINSQISEFGRKTCGCSLQSTSNTVDFCLGLSFLRHAFLQRSPLYKFRNVGKSQFSVRVAREHRATVGREIDAQNCRFMEALDQSNFRFFVPVPQLQSRGLSVFGQCRERVLGRQGRRKKTWLFRALSIIPLALPIFHNRGGNDSIHS